MTERKFDILMLFLTNFIHPCCVNQYLQFSYRKLSLATVDIYTHGFTIHYYRNKGI